MTVIRDIMQPIAVSLDPDATLAQAVHMLTAHRIESAPVVTAEGTLVGKITEAALLDIVFDATAKDACISEYMTRDVDCISPTESLAVAAQLFALHTLERLLVVEHGRLQGELSRRDLINYSLRCQVILTEPLLEIVPELVHLS